MPSNIPFVNPLVNSVKADVVSAPAPITSAPANGVSEVFNAPKAVERQENAPTVEKMLVHPF